MSDSKDAIGFYEARTRLSELLDDVERGRKIVITRHGKPIAMLAALPEETTEAEVTSDLLKFRETQQRTLGKLKLRDLIETGRK
jgi:antitoxin (DNA-binding transcriptional repressor) of toxin-antitoxin stability system